MPADRVREMRGGHLANRPGHCARDCRLQHIQPGFVHFRNQFRWFWLQRDTYSNRYLRETLVRW